MENNIAADTQQPTKSNYRNALYIVGAIVLFAIISWIYFTPSISQGKVLFQHDMQQGVAIGQEAKAFQEATGETTRWTNSLFGGMPNFQIAPSYDSSKILSVVGKIYSLGLPSPANLIFIMMLGFFILLLTCRVKWYLAIPGAIAYAFSSYFFIIIGAGHIWKFITLAYVPPTIAGMVLAYRGKYLLGGALTALFAALQIASNHVQMSYYFLFVIAFMFIAYLVSAIQTKLYKQFSLATLAMVIAAVLAIAANSSNLYNTYEYSKETMRGGHSELTAIPTDNNENVSASTGSNGGLSKDYITQWSYGKAETFSLLIPNIKGGASEPLANMDKAKVMIASGTINEQDAQTLSFFTQYFGDQPFTSGPVYVGAFVLVLFLIGCFIIKTPMKWALLAATILSILLSWGKNFMGLTDFMIDYFPMYNKFRTVSSILVVAEFTIPFMALMALNEIFKNPEILKAKRNYIFASFGICALFCIVAWIHPAAYGNLAFSEGDISIIEQVKGYYNFDLSYMKPTLVDLRGEMVSSDALRSLMFIVLGAAILLAFYYKKFNFTLTCVAVGLLILVDMYQVNKRYLNDSNFVSDTVKTVPFNKTKADEMILQDPDPNYRVYNMTNSPFNNAEPSYFHKSIGGYHAAKLRRYQDLIDRQIANGNMNVLNMLNTKYFIKDENTALLNDSALGNAWFVNEIKYVNTPDEEMNAITNFNPATTAIADKKFNSILGNNTVAPATDDTIYLTKYQPNKLIYKYKASAERLAVFSEIYFPWGWNATIDGKPYEIGRVNYVLRAMRLPAGEHTISMAFDPRSVHVTESIAYTAEVIILLAFVGVIAFTIVSARRRKQENE